MVVLSGCVWVDGGKLLGCLTAGVVGVLLLLLLLRLLLLL